MKKNNCYTNTVVHSLKKALWRKLLVISTTILLFNNIGLAQNPMPIGQSGKAGDFEIDGDFISNNCPVPSKCAATGIDWRAVLRQVDLSDPTKLVEPGISNVAGENAKWIVDGNSGSGVSIGNKEVETFAGTSNKNGDFITLATGASPYSIDTSNPSAPQKNDLTNIYVRSKDVSGQIWLHMGAETRSVDGTSYLDFEYNQAGITKSATQMYGPISLASTGGRTPRNTSVTPALAGDMLFVVDFSKGGGVPIPKVFEWRAIIKANKSTYGWVEVPIPAGQAYIVTNGNNVDPAGNNTAFAGDGSASNTTLALQFVEMGINISALFGNFDQCAPEATMLVKTRTSSSYTSELKDFSLFEFAITPQADIEDIANVAVCPSKVATFEAIVSGPGASAGNVEWYKVTKEATPTQDEELQLIEDDDTKYDISAVGSTSTLKIFNVVAADGGRYKAVLTGSTCGAAPEYATLTINTVDAPIVTLIEPSICEARPTGTLSVCNPEIGANYYLDQLDENGDPVSELSQILIDYQGGVLEFTDLVAGYPFRLKVEKDGCEAFAICADKADACPTSLNSTSSKIDGGSSSVSVEGVRNVDNIVDAKGEKLTAYPVPFSNRATVEFRMANTERYEINLYDMRGNLIKQLKAGKAKAGELQQVEVDGQKLPEGMYLVRVVTRDGAQTVKLLKKE